MNFFMRNVKVLKQAWAVAAVGAWLASPALGGPPQQARARMVDEALREAGITDPRVLQTMAVTPRHLFVPLRLRQKAYFDMALPIGHGQTISPPFVVAYMTEQLQPQPADRILEIGTGSGYQAAILSRLVRDVYTIEIVEALGHRAARTLKRLGLSNVHVRIGDGFEGWPEFAPFDKIIVTCSPQEVPQPLIDQLREGGLMVVPVGERYQQTLYLFTKMQGQLSEQRLMPTLFVPMTGLAERQRDPDLEPSAPAVVNGGFEQWTGQPQPRPVGWHYARQFRPAQNAPDAPEGKAYITFANQDAGRFSQALQGMALDGREVPEVTLSARVRGVNIQAGPHTDQRPGLIIVFYDERRATIGLAGLGPWQGTFAWQHHGARIPVPLAAREAIVRVGLFGGTGQLSVDAVVMAATAP